MTGQRDYVVATAANIDAREAYCRPDELTTGRAWLDANGKKGIRLRPDRDVPAGKVLVLDPPPVPEEEQFIRAFRAHAAWSAAMRFGPVNPPKFSTSFGV